MKEHNKSKWAREKPHNTWERLRLEDVCERKCYLLPYTGGKRARYPVCDSQCRIRPEGLRAAQARARLVIAKLRKNNASSSSIHEHEIALKRATSALKYQRR